MQSPRVPFVCRLFAVIFALPVSSMKGQVRQAGISPCTILINLSQSYIVEAAIDDRLFQIEVLRRQFLLAHPRFEAVAQPVVEEEIVLLLGEEPDEKAFRPAVRGAGAMV